MFAKSVAALSDLMIKWHHVDLIEIWNIVIKWANAFCTRISCTMLYTVY